MGHAKVLLGLDNDEQRSLLARRVVERGMSVRDTERLVQGLKRGHGPNAETARNRQSAEDAVIKDIQKRLQAHLGTSVLLRHTPKHGRIVIDYYGNEDLERILEKLSLDLR
ncbi:MAG: hypothetical protein WC360_03770 [Opitutales bacterium]